MILNILDNAGTFVQAIDTYWDLCIEHKLDFFEDQTMSFSCRSADVSIATEYYIETLKDRFVVKEVNISTDGSVSIVAQLDIEGMEGRSLRRFESVKVPIAEMATAALGVYTGGWSVGTSTVAKKRTVRMTNTSAIAVLKQALKTYRCEMGIDTLNKVISFVPTLGSYKGAYMYEELNLQEATAVSTTYDFYTQIEPYGKDDLNISKVNSGSKVLTNYLYSNKKKRLIWVDDRYTDADSLLEDAEAKLADLARPYKSYTAKVIDLAALSKDYTDLTFGLGDTIAISHSHIGIIENQRIVALKEYPDNPEKNEYTLANRRLTFDELTSKYDAAANTVSNITSDNGTVKGSTIDSIDGSKVANLDTVIAQTGTINNLTTNYLTVRTDLDATRADIGTLTANTATFEKTTTDHLTANDADITSIKTKDITAINGHIESLSAGYVSVSDTLTAYKGDFDTLNADHATFKSTTTDSLTAITADINTLKTTDLTAVKANIDTLTSGYANISSLLAGTAVTGDLQAIHLTAGNTVIDSALIKSAVANNISVSDLMAGAISTNRFTVASDDGRISIQGATQQWKDAEGRIRVQIGEDATGNFTFSLFDATGTGVLIDSTGIKSGAVSDGLVVDRMVADNAAIQASKLDIAGLWTELNGSTQTLKSDRIYFDEKAQTLTQAFGQMTTDISGTKQSVSAIQTGFDGLTVRMSDLETGLTTKASETSFEALRGKVSSVISDSEISQVASGTTMYSRLSSAEQTINGFNLQISTLQSDMDGKASASQLTTLSATVDGISTTVSNKVGADEIISRINQSAEAVTISADKVSLAATDIRMQGSTLAWTSNNSSLSASGQLQCSSLIATNGEIAGWRFTSTKLYGTGSNGKVAVMQKPAAANSTVFAAGGSSHADYSLCPFRVTTDGKLYASKGLIGGWTVQQFSNGRSGGKLCCTSSAGYASVLQNPQHDDGTFIATGGTSHANYTNSPFRVTAKGDLKARSAIIGGWKTDANGALHSDSGRYRTLFLSKSEGGVVGENTWAMSVSYWKSSVNKYIATWLVRSSGKMYAKYAPEIKGSANVSTIKIPTAISKSGLVTKYFTGKIVNGLIFPK